MDMAGSRNRTIKLSHIVGFDDCPFAPTHRGDVRVIGTVFAGSCLHSVLCGRVRRDGANATRVLGDLVEQSKFAPQLQLVMLQGIAVAGFNVVDVPALHARLGLPVLVVARREPDYAQIRRALLERVAGGRRKWACIEALGPMQPLAGVYVQRCGIEAGDAERVIHASAINGRIPEPLRCAHVIAGGVATGQSGRRV